MRSLVLLIVLYSGLVQAQNSQAYSDQDIRNYIQLGNKIVAFKAEQLAFAKRMQAELQISEADMEETLQRLRELGSWDQLKTELEPSFASRFDSLMTYRSFLKERIRQYMEAELKAINWTEDFYQHFLLTIEADPELQRRLIELNKTNP